MSEHKTTQCPNCGAPLDAYSYTCAYCGHVLLDRVRRTPNDPTDLTFQESVDITESNLNLIHEIPVPSFGRALADVARVYIIIFTFGIAAIFWKRPKKRFDKANYNALKQIVLRNIGFLRSSAKEAADLLSRISILENELHAVDKKIRNGLIVRVLTYILVPIAYIIFVSNNTTEIKNSEILKVKPVMATIKTEDKLLQDILSVSIDSCEISVKDSIKGVYEMPLIIKKRKEIDSSLVMDLELKVCFVDNPNRGLTAGCCQSLLAGIDEMKQFSQFLKTKDILKDTIILKLDKNERKYFDQSSAACSKEFIVVLKNSK